MRRPDCEQNGLAAALANPKCFGFVPIAQETPDRLLSWLRRHRLDVADLVGLGVALGVVARWITPLPFPATASAMAAAAMLPSRAHADLPSPDRAFRASLPRRLIYLAAVGIAWVGFFGLPARSLWLGPIWIALAWAASLDWRPAGRLCRSGLDRLGAFGFLTVEKPRVLAEAVKARVSPRAQEPLRLVLVVALALWLMRGFNAPFLLGGGDSGWYGAVLADAVRQAREGVFPLWVGQSAYQFNGAISPIRIAPAFCYAGALLDLVTLHRLGDVALLNALLTAVGVGAALSAYLCLGALIPARRWLAAALAALFLACPGVLGIAYNGDLYMSWMALPLVPLVFLGTVLSFRPGTEGRALVLLGAALGLCWWAHAPIALWATALAAGAQGVRVVAGSRAGVRWRPLLAAALAFLAIAAYPIGSVLLYPPVHGQHMSEVQRALPGTITSFIRDTFPGALLPMTAIGRAPSDVQFGYALWALLLFCLFNRFRGAPLEVRVLLAEAAFLAVLLLPIPGASLLAWELVPGFIRNPTGNWAAPRLYLPMAAATVFALAAGLGAGMPLTRERRGGLAALLLAGGCAWSLLEASKFSAETRVIALDPVAMINRVSPENLQLTRYSYGMFPRLPATFTHGVTDPLLENRLIDTVTSAPIVENAKAALASSRLVSSETFVKRHHGDADFIELDAPFHIEPGRSYLLQLVIQREDFAVGVLQIKGRDLFREYGLPEHGGARAFGVGGEHLGVVPLWTTQGFAEDLGVRFFPAALLTLDQGLRFATRARLLSYDPGALPVRVSSWIPYTAEVRSPTAALLETPRMFQPGYAARVNGSEAAVSASPDGLACVAVPAGASRVELAYVPPAGLRLLFWLSAAGALGVAAAGAGRLALARARAARTGSAPV